MKRNKWTNLLGAALLVAVACSREEEPQERALPSAEGKKVRVEFSIAGGMADPSTKGLDNGGDINHMYVAVFGSSGFLKEYAEATLEEYDGSTTTYYTDSGETDGNGDPILIPHTVKLYKFSVPLTITDSPRKVHFLGNGPASLPFGYDTAVMPIQMSQLNDQNQGEKAYWQMIDLPEGIQAKRDAQGNFIDKDGDRYLDGNGNTNPAFNGFILDPGQEHYFREIPLIRNWAKIVLYTQEGSHFTPISFSVINYPFRGAVAPYSGKTGFIRNYQDMDFITLQGMGYTANLPAGTEFDDSKPSADEFKADPSTFVDGGRVAAALQSKAQVVAGEDTEGHAVYLYERPVPSEKIPPTYVIVYGHYSYPPHGKPGDADYDPGDPDHEGDYFYKVDLMETFQHENGEWESSYYPIYRNFKYQICITKILSMGYADPVSAAASAGSADVSADISTGHISDISDGVGRLHLTWMTRSYNTQVTKDNPESTLKVYFATTDGVPIIGTDENPAVTAKLLPPSDGGDDIIFPAGESYDPEHPETFFVGRDDDGDGWRPIEFCTAAPGRTIRSQTLRITGNHNEGRLYRDVVITVLPTQEMRVTCDYPVLHAQKGIEQTVTVSIPEGLTKNLFPIEFEIEPQDRTLTPDTNKEDNNLPVVIAASISDDAGYAGKPSYHFTRTLTWEQYKAAPIVRTADGGDKTWRTFTCYFKTNCPLNATKVWVQSAFFSKTSASFSNYSFGLIHDARIPVPVPPEAGGNSIPFEFQIEPDEHGVYPELTLRLTCLTNDSEKNIGVTRGDDVDSFLFTPTKAENVLYFFSTTNDGEFSLEISASGSSPVVVEPYRFNKGITTRSYGLLDGVCDPLHNGKFWSNMAYGRAQSTNNRNASERGLIFGYYDDPGCPGPTQVTLKDLDGNIISNNNNNTSGVRASKPSSYPCMPDPKDRNVNPYYHELQLLTVSARKEQDIHLVLSSPGYVTETYHYPRLKEGNGKTHIHTSHFTSADYNTTTKILQPKDNNKDKSYFHLIFTPLDGAPDPVVSSGNLYLGRDGDNNVKPGSRYELKVISGDVSGISGMEDYPKNQRFFCGFFKFVDGFEPASCEPGSGCGTWFQYPGSKGWYEWLAYDSTDEYQRMSHAPATNPEKTMIVTVGETPILLSNFTYKAISDYY